MRRLSIDFADRRRRASRRAGRWLLAAVAAATAVALWHGAELGRELDRWQGERDRWRGAGKVVRSGAPAAAEAEAMRAELRQSARLIGRFEMPWDALLGAVESAASEHVALLALEPDSERRELRLTAETRDATGLHDYLRRLSAAPAFRAVVLASHQVNEQDPQRPIRFVVHARWGEPVAGSGSRSR